LFKTINKDYRTALFLSFFTIAANLAEGVFSTILGQRDGALALFGFGLDSFIEVLSAIGISIMIVRIAKSPGSSKSRIEISALRITGTSFYLLTLGLVITAFLKVIQKSKPETALSGLVISILSLSVMTFLYMWKMKVGRKLNSAPIISDANCTKTCIYMSVILLVSSLVYLLTNFGYVDLIGALGIAWFSFSEGREAFEKAASKEDCDCD
jgi:divalent metal cation (Fe/Co/Zn/Cd) transporter